MKMVAMEEEGGHVDGESSTEKNLILESFSSL